MSFGRLGSLGRGFGRLGGGGRAGSGVIPGTIAAGGGSYVWTGQDASLVIAETARLAADAGSYAWAGDTMMPLQDHFVTASGGSYAWTGQDATLTASGGGLGLQTDLTSFWELSESSGTRADSVVASANDLTDNNTVTGGNDGVAYSQFTRTNSEYLSRADNASLSLGNISFSASAWFYMDSLNAEMIVSKRGGFGQSEWDLGRVFTSGHVIRLRIFNSSNSAQAVEVAAPATGGWHFACVTCDVSGNISIALDNGTPVTAAKTITIQNGNGAFQIGAANGAAEFFDGRIRRVGFWKNRVLSSGDQTALYNGGAGLSYAAMA